MNKLCRRQRNGKRIAGLGLQVKNGTTLVLTQQAALLLDGGPSG